MRLQHIAFTFALLVGFAPSSRAQSTPAASTTIIFVRHAEKAADPATDPPLTLAGAARASTLAQVLKDAGVSAVISTQYRRTKGTATATAGMLSLPIEVLDAALTPAATRDSILAKHRGQTILVVGHSNTLPALVEVFGVPRPAEICDAGYDNLYVVTLPARGEATVLHLHYGVPAPCTAAASMMRP